MPPNSSGMIQSTCNTINVTTETPTQILTNNCIKAIPSYAVLNCSQNNKTSVLVTLTSALQQQPPPQFNRKNTYDLDNQTEQGQLMYHSKLTEAGRLFYCHFCTYQTRVLTNLQNHLRTHTNEKPFACSYCSYRSNQHSNLKTHVKKHHEKTADTTTSLCLQ